MSEHELKLLTLRYLDGMAEPADFQRLVSELRRSNAARQLYWDMVRTYQAFEAYFEDERAYQFALDTRFEQGLAELLACEQQSRPQLRHMSEQELARQWAHAEPGLVRRDMATHEPACKPEPRMQKLLEIGPVRVTRRPRPAGAHRGVSGRLAWAAGIAAMLVMTVLLMQKPERVGQPEVDVARISDAVGAEWVVRDEQGAALEAGVGDGLVAGGVLEVQRGFVQLEMANQTRVVVEGPAELELTREALVRMERGRLVARTNGGSETFTVVTPTASVTDLGTEFGVRVDENGRTETSVFEGLARVIGLGDGSLPRVRIGEGFTATAMGEGEPTVRASDERDGRAFVRAMPGSEYEAVVQQSRPVAYWRFDAIEDGVVRNKIGDRYHAELIGDAHINADRSALALPDSPSYARVDPIGELQAATSYTIECWVKFNDDQGSKASAIAILAEADSSITVAPGYLGIEEGRFRALHRSPPARRGGTELTTETTHPNQWHHLAFTKSGPDLVLYVDGIAVVEATDSTPLPKETIGLWLGRHEPGYDQDRQLLGQLAEVAIYDHALAPTTVTHHYKSMTAQAHGR